MKKIISGLCAISIFFSTGSAFVTYDIPVREEKIISINYISSNEESSETIDLSEYEDVKIVDYEMTKGDAIFNIEDEELIVDLYEGQYFNGETIIEKIKTEEIEDLILKRDNAIFIPEEVAKRIIKSDGDFESGIIDGEKIVLKLAKGATGTKGYNKEKTVKSTVTIEVDKDNSDETIYSDFYKIIEEMPDKASVKIKETSINADARAEIEDQELRILFKNGTPQINESTKTDGYGYYWIDRALDGTFRDKYPNSIYRTDKFYFEGRGAYINDERLIIERKFEDNWQDYVGYTLGNKRYVYLLSDVPEELFKDATILKDSSNIFTLDMFEVEDKLNWMNSDELTVEITEDSIRYIPQGNLYSMGELVAYSEGWGETVPNRSDESTESFFNNISGRMETYVKHFKFFYGPKEKISFGGKVTYPYKATVEYEHYEPTNLYNGSVTYAYDEVVEDVGYEFSGWVKISYKSNETVNDYPPQAPYNVIYNKVDGFLEWQPAIDDYTKADDMVYEIEVAAGDNFSKVGIVKGMIKINYQNGARKTFRVRAKDNQNQFSDWAYSDESSIQIVGSVNPQEVFSCETIDIEATVKSLKDIKSVQAYSEELGISEELIEISKKVPNAVEVSFNLLNYVGKEPVLIVDDMTYAMVEEDDIKIKYYYPDAETKSSRLDIDLPDNIKFNTSGTIIFPNQNYTNTPSEMKVIDRESWYFYTTSGINFINKNTGKEDVFIQFLNDDKTYLVGRREYVEVTPYVKVNLFKFNNGIPQYEKIPVNSNIATKPIAVSWRDKGEKIEFVIYVDGEYFYSYEANKNDVIDVIEGFSSYTLSKLIYQMRFITDGYQYDPKGKDYNWANMYKQNDLLKSPWLGYKILYKDNYYEEYNNLTTTRDVNRLIFLDESISENAINLYLSKIESTNLLIDRKNKETVFADDVQEKVSEYTKKNILIDKEIEEGIYDITIVATSIAGEIEKVIIPLSVKTKSVPKISQEDIDIGRFFYKNNNKSEKYVEELSLTKFNLDTKGFISAGETLAIVINSEEEISEITVDFIGDKSIKEYDDLTEKFLGEKQEMIFPLTIYPDEEGVFLYTIPYKTKQTLESWTTLREKSGDYENIDKNKLFSRISEPYQIKIQINEEEFIYEFDVFERWDTVLNRDASKYITNSNQKWRIKL